jgi:cytochrome P450
MLDVFGGPNIATVSLLYFSRLIRPSNRLYQQASGKHWKKHRKVIQTSLNERCNAVVWTEAALLGDQMVRDWASKGIFTSVEEDARTVSLNILCKAYFGQSYPFEGMERTATQPIPRQAFDLL